MPTIKIINPNTNKNPIMINVGLTSIVPVGEEGEHKYVFTIVTRYNDKDGNPIEPLYVHTTSISGFWEALPDAIISICKKIDWGNENTDRFKPYVDYYTPKGNDVSLFSSVIVKIGDHYPSLGIDKSSIKMYINNIDVTSDSMISGFFNDVEISWSPKKRLLNNG